MADHLLPLRETLLAVPVIFLAFLVGTKASTDTDFLCSIDSPPSCQTFITYRALSPGYNNLDSIATLLGVNSSIIAKTSNLATDTESSQLLPNQILLVPIRCTCNGSYYFYNATYPIQKDDSFYSVSIRAFQNLTNFHFVGDMNPQFNPLNLTIGSNVTFPLQCKCNSQSNVKNGFQYIITYVWQPGDDLESVAHMFNTTPLAILEENNYKNLSASLCLPIKIPIQKPFLSQIFTPSPTAKPTSRRHKSNLGTILSILVVVFMALSILACLYVRHKKKMWLLRTSSSSDISPLTKTTMEFTTNPDKILGVSGYLCNTKLYGAHEINEGTGDFSEQNRIGGSIYRAKIKDQVFAVKKTKDASEEMRMLQKFKHSNLIQLMGISSGNQDNFFLVYEYAENGSLDKWLFPKTSSTSSGSESCLSWSQRLCIALDLAHGLQYMHEHTQPSIAHRDIRTSNILLDSRFKAKISNFSSARPAENRRALKTDVFAFGVVLLELISGKKSVEARNGDIKMTWKEIRRILDGEDKEEGLRRWMDPKLKDFYDFDSAMSIANLAKACTAEKSSDRPKMADIVFSLCVLSQASSEIYGKYWNGETDEAVEVIVPVVAR